MKKLSILFFVGILVCIGLLYKNFPLETSTKIIENEAGERILVEQDPMTHDIVETPLGDKRKKATINTSKDKLASESSETEKVVDNTQKTNDLESLNKRLDKENDRSDLRRKREEELAAAIKLESQLKLDKEREDRASKLELAKKNQLSSSSVTVDKIVRSARSKLGKPFKRAGLTDRGYDCSGLIKVSFAKYKIKLPRASYQMARRGKQVALSQVIKGDLLFFGLSSTNSKRINHVGLVTKVEEGVVYFIHSKEHSGVIENTLEEGFYSKRLLKVKRYVK